MPNAKATSKAKPAPRKPLRKITPVAETLMAGVSSVTAPGAGGAIATLAAPPAGTYNVRVRAGYGGTLDVLNNIELRPVGSVYVAEITATRIDPV